MDRKGFLFATFLAPLLALFRRRQEGQAYEELRWDHADATQDPDPGVFGAEGFWNEAVAKNLDARLDRLWHMHNDRRPRPHETVRRFHHGPLDGRLGYGHADVSRDNWLGFHDGDMHVYYGQDIVTGNFMFDPNPPLA